MEAKDNKFKEFDVWSFRFIEKTMEIVISCDWTVHDIGLQSFVVTHEAQQLDLTEHALSRCGIVHLAFSVTCHPFDPGHWPQVTNDCLLDLSNPCLK